MHVLEVYSLKKKQPRCENVHNNFHHNLSKSSFHLPSTLCWRALQDIVSSHHSSECYMTTSSVHDNNVSKLNKARKMKNYIFNYFYRNGK